MPSRPSDIGHLVGRRQADPGDRREALGDQSALELDRDPVLFFVQLRTPDGQCGAVGRVLEQRALGGAERASRGKAQAQATDVRPLDDQRHLAPAILFQHQRVGPSGLGVAAHGAHHERAI
jgi:hypothetical protein